MRPAVFFDRDNTLIVTDDYFSDAQNVILMPGAAECIAILRDAGFAIVTVSNQSGVARGMFGEDAVRAVDQQMDRLLLADSPLAEIDAHYFCPHHPQMSGPCDCRKPLPGMLLTAAAALSIDLSQSWLIGDAPRDIQAGHAAGCRTVLFPPPGVPASPAARARQDVTPDASVSDLRQAARFIIAKGSRPG